MIGRDCPAGAQARSALHNELDAILDAAAHGEAVPSERLWGFLADISGGVLADRLHDDALDAMRQFGIHPNTAEANADLLRKKYHQAVLLRLVLASAPVLPGNFKEQPIADDLIAMLGDSGGPRLLVTAATNTDKRIKETARSQFVLGVIYLAANEGVSRETVRKRVGMVDHDAWKKWCKQIPLQAREDAADAGRAGSEWDTPTDDVRLEKLYLAGFSQKLP